MPSQLTYYLTGMLNLEEHSIYSVRSLVYFCFNRHLPALRDNIETKENKPRQQHLTELKQLKDRLIDLWLFAAYFGVPKLQNEAMRQLLGLFTIIEPHYLTKKNIAHIWEYSALDESELKWFAIFTAVAQIEEGIGVTREIKYFKDPCAKLEDFMIKMYEGLQLWNAFDMPKSPKKGKKQRSKWSAFAISEVVQDMVKVDEPEATQQAMPQQAMPQQQTQSHTTTQVQQPTPTPTLAPDTPTQHQIAVRIKREAPDEDNSTDESPSKKARPFAPGEVIVLDDD